MDRSALDLDGVIVVDKPAGITSASVVGAVRRRLRIDRAGHTGTLDPLATGVLPVCLGDATKLATWLVADDKAYEAELELGAVTDTLDADGTIVAEDREAAARVTAAQLEAALAAMVGPSMQVPPMYSAIKRGNKRLHELARAGEVVAREPRPIVLHRLALLDFAPPRARIAVDCTKGTYVRSVVDDLGRALGCGAHLTGLRRTRSGRFGLEGAIPLDDLTPERAAATILPTGQVLDLPRVTVPDTAWSTIRNGDQARVRALLPEGERFQLLGSNGRLLALVHLEGEALVFDRVMLQQGEA